MPNKKLKDVPEGKAGEGLRALSPEVRNKMGFKMDPKVVYMTQVAGTPSMKMGDKDQVMKLEHEDKIDLVSGNNVSIDSKGTTLNTNVQGENTGTSTTVKKSGGSGKSYSEAYKDADKTKYPTLASFTKAAEAYNQSENNSSSKPNVSTTKKTNISVDNLLSPKLTKLEAEFAKIRHNNVQGEITAIADSTAVSQTLKGLGSLGRLTADKKAEILRNELPDAGQNTYIKSGKGRNARGANILGPFQDTNTFIDYVSGRAADKARANVNSDKPAQSPKFNVASDNVYLQPDFLQPKGKGVSTKAATGFSYEEIKKKSGEQTMQLATTYFNKKRNKK